MINYGKQSIDKKDIQSVIKTLKSDFLTQGPRINEFETKIKNYIGAKYCCAVNSGTAALHLAILALNVRPKDIVLTTPITFLASANAILYAKAKPHFIDINPKDYCIDVNKLEKNLIKLKKRGKKIKAAIITDFAGQACDWKKLRKLSKKFNFKTINDNCHSLGSKYFSDTKYASKYADIVTHSFHPVKIITTGEGGSLSTNHKKFFEKATLLRSHGVFRSNKLKNKYGNWFYKMKDLGYNYRISDINCALGISQFKKINKFIKKRKLIAKFYDREFKNSNNFITPRTNKNCEHSFHLYVLKINFKKLKITKRILFKKLLSLGINLQVHYIPIHLQDYYRKNFNFKFGQFPISETFYKNAISLPIFPNLTNKQLSYIVKTIKRLCK